jgi:hypothetical protein
MRKPVAIVIAATLLMPLAQAKNKEAVLPPEFLIAHTVNVMVDPAAGVDPKDPNANQVAQKDVETALLNWGRFFPLISTDHADLIIVIRKGSGKLANTTISDPRQNNRAGVITPIDDGIYVGAQRGTPPPPRTSGGPANPQASSPNPQAEPPHPKAEIGYAEDSFEVYDGKADHPLKGIPGWRYSAKDALHSHNVPAVDKFRKAIEEAEKAAAKTTPSGNPPANPPTNAPNNPQPSNP